MNTAELRLAIKKVVDRLPPERLASLADYVDFLNRLQLVQRVTAAEKAIAAGQGVAWQKVREDVWHHPVARSCGLFRGGGLTVGSQVDEVLRSVGICTTSAQQHQTSVR